MIFQLYMFEKVLTVSTTDTASLKLAHTKVENDNTHASAYYLWLNDNEVVIAIIEVLILQIVHCVVCMSGTRLVRHCFVCPD